MDIRDILTNARNATRERYDDGIEQLLDQLGLQHKPTLWDVIVPTFAVFGSGFAIGGILGLAFAPKTGEEFRHDVRDRLDDIKSRSVERYGRIVSRTQEPDESPAQLEHGSDARGVA